MTDAQKRAKKKYDKANVKQVIMRLNKNTDADILEKLSCTENKQGYLKQLIRNDLKKQ